MRFVNFVNYGKAVVLVILVGEYLVLKGKIYGYAIGINTVRQVINLLYKSKWLLFGSLLAGNQSRYYY